MEGRFVPGEDLSLAWIDDVNSLDELKQLVTSRSQAAVVYVFAKEDASSPEARALHVETFLDERVRKAGRVLPAVTVDRGAKAELAQALGVKTTPAIVVFKKDGTEAARFEGAIKPGPLAKALEAVQKK
jgi:thioredoxin-like negative regulator of GroEL